MLAKQAELAVERRVAGREHPAVARGDHLSGVEREAGHRSVRPADRLPAVAGADLAADGAGRVFDDGQAVTLGHRNDGGHVTGQADLMDRHNGLGPRRDGFPETGGVDVVCPRVDVHEHRRCPTIANRVGGRDKGVADRDHLIAGADAENVQGQMQRRGAAGDGTGVGGADVGGELRLEGGDLRPLRDPPGQDGFAGRRRLGLAERRLGDGDRGLRDR